MNGLAQVGPVKIDWHSEPSISLDSPKDPDGLRVVKIAGEFQWDAAAQLSELDANENAKVTIGAHRGVPLPIWMNNAPELDFTIGWYIFESFSLQAGVDQSREGLPLGTIIGSYLGDQPEVIIARGAVPRGNDFGLAARSLVVSPFRPVSDTGDEFLVTPGGTFATRAYDPSYPHDTSRLSPDSTALIGFYAGTVTDSTDDLRTVAFPRVNFGSTTPAWVIQQGGNCRAYDRRCVPTREVYGPHTFLETTDLGITNGLLRAWVGNEGRAPFLNVEVFAQGDWRETGYLHLADPTEEAAVLRDARLVSVTAESVTVALSVQNLGDVLVTLRRGERMFRITHGNGVSAPRRVQWAGLPPWERLEAAGQGTGKFGKGVKSESDGGATWGDPEAGWGDTEFGWGGQFLAEPDFRLRWPLGNTDWTLAWWYTADQAVADHKAGGQWTVTDDGDGSPVRIYFDAGSNRFKATIGATTLQSSVQTFAAGDGIFLALSLSPAGIVFTVGTEHITSAVTDDGTTGNYSGLMLGIGSVPYGSGLYGAGPYGGLTFPDGVMSDVGIWRRALTTAELTALAAATHRFDNLPEPEGDLVWYTSFDPRPILRGSAFVSGRRYEATAEGGSTRNADSAGLTKALAVLETGAVGIGGLVLLASTDELEIAAYMATTATQDDLADHHAQFAAESQQRVRVR